MSGRYTPGPWRRFPVSNLIVSTNAEGEGVGRPVCTLSQLPDADDECDANGRLIAAAPEMLDALEQAQQVFEAAARAIRDDDDTAEQCQQAARAIGRAIARARGEPPTNRHDTYDMLKNLLIRLEQMSDELRMAAKEWE
jgi:hypothetical protein